MNFVQYLFLFILSSVLLMAQSESILEESYKHLADNTISTEKQYELANTAMDFGLFENAVEIYESLFLAEEIVSPNINQDELRFSLIKAHVGNRNFDSAESLLNETPKAQQGDQYFLYNLITQYVLNYKQSKKDLLDLLKRNLKQIKVENLNDEEKAWYYYFRATEELIKGKKGDLKNSLFQAKVFSEPDEERRAFFESLILRLDYNIQIPSLQTIRQLKKLLKANENKKKWISCIQLILIYLRNIIQAPHEEKFRCIKKLNRKFQENISKTNGALALMHMIGWEENENTYILL